MLLTSSAVYSKRQCRNVTKLRTSCIRLRLARCVPSHFSIIPPPRPPSPPPPSGTGHVPSGLHVHPDGTHVVHALGTSVVVMELATGRQRFLTGHSHNVSCVDVSRSGKYIASGQVNFMGFRVGRAQTVQWRGGTLVVELAVHWLRVSAVIADFNMGGYYYALTHRVHSNDSNPC